MNPAETSTRALALRPGLDPAPYARIYREQGMVQVADVLAKESAEALAATLERATAWSLVHADADGGHALLSPADLARTPADDLRRRLAAAARQATAGFSYIYQTYPMVDAWLDQRDPAHLLHALVEFLNGPEVLSFLQAVTGETAARVDAQASCYRPGHFLALHDDRGVGERRAAYTIGLTRNWRPDWGGQLLFHDAAGDIARGFRPGFNLLTLFRVPLAHSVAPVAPYAGAARYSIAGWLQDEPPLLARRT